MDQPSFFLDSACADSINEYLSIGLISGVTTNPSLLRKQSLKEEIDPLNIIKKIVPLVSPYPVSVQCISSDYQSRVEEAKFLSKIGPNVIIKLPPDRISLKILKNNKDIADRANITGVFSLSLLASFAIFSPRYISFILDKNEDWGISPLYSNPISYRKYNPNILILGASIRSVDSFNRALISGFDILTIPPSTFDLVFSDIRSNHVINEMNNGWNHISQAYKDFRS